MKFGFVFHLFTREELEERNISTDTLPCGFPVTEGNLKAALEKREILECGSMMQITSGKGGSCSGKEWILPLSARSILMKPGLALEMTSEACQSAGQWGAEILGLGFFLGKIGGRGKSIRERISIPITVGDSYLVFHAVQMVNRLLDFFELDPGKEKISLFGFPSTVGGLITEYLVSLGMNVLLVAKPTKYMQRIVNRISSKYHTRLPVISSIREAQKSSRIMLTVGRGEQIVHVDEFDRPMVIIDVSFPRNVPAGSEKVLVLDAGVIAFPRTHLRASGFHAQQVMSCLVEVITLSLENKKEDYSLGRNVSLEKVREIGQLAQKHGFKGDTFYHFGNPIKQELLLHFKEFFK